MHTYALHLSPICTLSLFMSQLRICLQVTINPFPPGIGPHRNQANNPPQHNVRKMPVENSYAQWSFRSTACKFNKNFLPHRYFPTPHQSKPLTQSPPPTHTNQSPRQERVNTKQVDLKTITSTSRRSLMKRVTTSETHTSHRISSKTWRHTLKNI